MFRKLAVIAALLVTVSPRLSALGLGEIDMQSVLNQPLRAVVELTSPRDTALADIRVSLASLADHQRAGLSKAEVLAGLRFEVVREQSGRAVVHITSADPVREPYLEFLLELEWPRGRLLREYTVLVDPPVTMQAIPAAPQTPVTQAARPSPATPAVSPAPVTTPAPVAVPVAAVAPDRYGPIRRNETLWSIADRLRPDNGVTVHQMMQALLRANPTAFIDSNINNMKAGVTMQVPGREEILSMSASEARAESRRQYNEWKAASQAVVEQQAAAPVEPAVQETAAQTAPEAAEESAAQQPAEAAAEPVQAESRLSLVAPEGEAIAGAALPGDSAADASAPDSAAELNMQLTLATEEAEASRAQSLELQSRVERLEEQIETMKRLLELKDTELARLQVSASESEQQAVPDASSAGDEAAPTAGGERPSDIVGRLMDNPLLAGAGVLVTLLLGIFLWMAGRRRGQSDLFDDGMTLESRLARDSDSAAGMSATALDLDEDIWEEGPEETLHADEQDAVTEADVYLAYGRVQQAEDVLQAALENDPHDDACRLKLLEVYHAAGNAAAFEQAAKQYRDSVAGDNSRWLKVAEMGRMLSPENELYKTDVDSGAEFDMDLSGMDQLSDTGHGIDFSMDSIEPEDEQEGLLASDDEVTTKLDLARAYIDMDDRESARSILGEVIEEGNLEQKQEAEKIIARLA